VQVALKAFRGRESLQDAALVVGSAAVVAGGGFQAFVHPAALFGVGDVHELGTDAAGVGRLQKRQQIAQLHALAASHAAGAELDAGVAFGQPVEAQRQVGRIGFQCHLQRIEVGRQVAAGAIRGDQLADPAFAFVARGRVGSQCAARGIATGDGDLLDDGRVRHVAGFATLQGIEILLPLRPDAVGRHQVLLVQAFDIGGIRPELRGLGKLLQETVHHGVGGGLVSKWLIRLEFAFLPVRTEWARDGT